MPGPTAVIRYTCACGKEYLIAIPAEGDAVWLETIQQVGRALEIDVIDAAMPSFVCIGCGDVHLRDAEPEPAGRSTGRGLVETLFSQASRTELS